MEIWADNCLPAFCMTTVTSFRIIVVGVASTNFLGTFFACRSGMPKHLRNELLRKWAQACAAREILWQCPDSNPTASISSIWHGKSFLPKLQYTKRQQRRLPLLTVAMWLSNVTILSLLCRRNFISHNLLLPYLEFSCYVHTYHTSMVKENRVEKEKQ